MEDPEAQTRAHLHQLWSANFLNLRRATEEARTQARTRLDVGVELVDMTFTNAWEFHPYAADCLSFLSRNAHFAVMIWTVASSDQVAQLVSTKLQPNGIHIRGINENPLRRNLNWDPRKPWFDVLLDRTSGFDPAAGHWYWLHGLCHIAAESLSSTRSGATIIRNADRFAVTVDTKTHRRLV